MWSKSLMVSHFYFHRLMECFSELNMVHEWQISCRFFVILRFYCWGIFIFDILFIQLHAAEEIEQRRESQNNFFYFVILFSMLSLLDPMMHAIDLSITKQVESIQTKKYTNKAKYSIFVTSAGLGLNYTGCKHKISLSRWV